MQKCVSTHTNTTEGREKDSITETSYMYRHSCKGGCFCYFSGDSPDEVFFSLCHVVLSCGRDNKFLAARALFQRAEIPAVGSYCG